jgi:hypothetical protein
MSIYLIFNLFVYDILLFNLNNMNNNLHKTNNQIMSSKLNKIMHDLNLNLFNTNKKASIGIIYVYQHLINLIN